MFSLRETTVFSEGNHRFLSEKTQKTIGFYTQNYGLLLRLNPICCHPPPICHHLKTPLDTGISEVWWQVADKTRKTNSFAQWQREHARHFHSAHHLRLQSLFLTVYLIYKHHDVGGIDILVIVHIGIVEVETFRFSCNDVLNGGTDVFFV